MSPLTLVVRRLRARLGLVVTIALLVTATTAIIAGTVGYARAAATTAARLAVSDTAEPTEAGIRVQTRLGEDPAAQDAAARRLVEEAFAPADVAVQRTLAAEPRPVSGREERVQAIAGEAFAEPGVVEVVDGAWADAGTSGGLLHTGAAGRWDVAVGDTLDLQGVPVQVTGLWRPTDPEAAIWFGDPLAASGGTDGVVGPLLVGPELLAELGDTPFVQWTVQPQADTLEPDDLTRLADAARTLQSTLRTPTVEVRGVTVEGDLAPTAASAARNLATARALNVVPVVLLLGVSVIAVVQLARLLAAARSGEVEVFVARGASRRQVVLWSLAEAVAVTLLGAAAGALVAVVVLQGVPAGPAQAGGTVVTAALVALGVLVALAAVTTLQVREVTERGVADRSGRTRAVAAVGTVGLTVAAAALAWWQLRRYGSPLVEDAEGALRSDLLAGAAPTLLLAACAVLATALLGPVSRVVEGVTRPTRRLVAHLSAAQVARHLVVYAVPVVLTVLAVGATVLAGLYAATSADLRAGLTDLGRGADLRAGVTGATPSDGVVGGLPTPGAQESVDAVAPVWLTETQVGSGRAELVLAPLPALEEVAVVPAGAADPAELVSALGPAETTGAVELPADIQEVAVEVAVTADLPEASVAELDAAAVPGLTEGQEVRVAVRVLDPTSGVSRTVPVGRLPLPLDVTADGQDITSRPGTARDTFTLRLPPATGTTYLLTGVDLELPLVTVLYDAAAEVAAVPDGDRLPGSVDAAGWAATAAAPPGTVVTPADTGGVRIEVTTPQRGRFVATDSTLVPVGPVVETAGPVPVAVTQSLADGADLAAGSPLTLQVFGSEVAAEVVAVVAAVPGMLARDVVLADSVAVSEALRADARALGDPTELWLATADPAAALEQVAALPGVGAVQGPGAVSVTDAASAVRLVFWVASAGAVLLAVTGIAAVAATLLAGRRPEVAVLRALGMRPAAQARARGAELAGVVAASVLLGLAAGWLVGAAVVPELARSTTLTGGVGLPVRLNLEAGPALTVLGVGGVAVALVVVVLGLRVRAQAMDRTYREEIR